MICVKLKATAIPKTANGNENGKKFFFNLPFSKSVKTNFGKVFCQLLSKYFFKKYLFP